MGGFLGTLFIIPLRKYFVKELHGELPFPEATAINEILVTGESATGGAGKILLMSFALGALYDFSVEALHLWNGSISTSVVLAGLGDAMNGIRLEVSIAAIAALFGLGYIIGVKYASIIASGSVLAMLVMVPIVYLFGRDYLPVVGSAEAEVLRNIPLGGFFADLGLLHYAGKTFDIEKMSAMQIFGAFIKPVGIGAIAVSGLVGIMRMWKIVAGSVTQGFKGLSRARSGEQEATERTQRDMAPGTVLGIQALSALAMGVLFFVVAMITEGGDGSTYGLGDSLLFGVVGMIVGFILSFLFTPVAAQAIAIVGVNPVSGMTLITVVLAIGCMILVGLEGTAGMIIALIIGTAVCTALSTSGALISDFKIGYWLGSTPRNQQVWKFLGVVVAALVVAIVIPLMDQAYHFLVLDEATGMMVSNEKVLPAPQANMIAAVASGLMEDPANQPWLLYGLGALVALMLLMSGLPMLAFALGMYLPI